MALLIMSVFWPPSGSCCFTRAGGGGRLCGAAVLSDRAVDAGGPAAARQSFGAYAIARARGLLLPWLAWSAVYGGVKVAEAVVGGQPPGNAFAPWMLLTGPAIHLWFLPFAFAASLLDARTDANQPTDPPRANAGSVRGCGPWGRWHWRRGPPCPPFASASGLRWWQSGRAP